MGWQRNKALTTVLSPAPSLLWWLMAGVAMAFVGALLFILHASGTVKTLVTVNIWWLSLTPVGLWILLFFLRGWLWDLEVNRYTFLQKEAVYAQKQWEDWAERHLTVLGSCLFLPDKISVACLHDQLPQQYGLVRKINYLAEDLSPGESATNELLKGIRDALLPLPLKLPLRVNFITDLPGEPLRETFNAAWKTLLPERQLPTEITTTDAFSFSHIEARIEQPVLTVDLILVVQLNGDSMYSDGLAALLLTSDDVTQKYRLPHKVNLLRPMPLTMTTFEEEMMLFLETQTVACRTSRILGDIKEWEKSAATLMAIGAEKGAVWQPEERMILEKFIGIPGPAAPWLLTALAADLVSLHDNPLLTLFSSEKENFISTITSGSEDEPVG